MRNRDVARAFAEKRPGRSVNFYTDGQTAWSYGTVIAEWHGGVVWLNDRKYSVSTTQHQHSLAYSLAISENPPITRTYEGPPAKMWRSWRDGSIGRARP